MSPMRLDGEEASGNVARFDIHHHRLEEALNEIHRACAKGDDDSLRERLGDLCRYWRYHCYAEETEMERYGFHGIEEQREEHRETLDLIRQYIRELDNGKVDLTLEELESIQDRLLEHFRDRDTEYGEFFQGKPV